MWVDFAILTSSMTCDLGVNSTGLEVNIKILYHRVRWIHPVDGPQ